MANKILVIEGTTRPNRASKPLAEWLVAHANERFEDSTFELVDLEALGLPLMDEPEHPASGNYTQAHTKRWSQLIEGADGILFLVGEYNHGYPAPLKNAVDFLYHEWSGKPTGLLSYSGVDTAGVRALEQFKLVAMQVKMRLATNYPSIPNIGERIEDGVYDPSERTVSAIDKLLDELTEMVARQYQLA